jgi:GDPmannose 4,6-dehydratase
VDSLLGDATMAKRDLGWTPRVGFGELIREMTLADLDLARRDALVNEAGFRSFVFNE